VRSRKHRILVGLCLSN